MSCPVTSLTYRCAIPALLCAATTPHVASSRTNKCPTPRISHPRVIRSPQVVRFGRNGHSGAPCKPHVDQRTGNHQHNTDPERHAQRHAQQKRARSRGKQRSRVRTNRKRFHTAVQHAVSPARVAARNRSGARNQRSISTDAGRRVRQTVSRNEMDGPQYNGHTAEENRRAVVTAGQRRRKSRINRPNKGANKREHIR